jgi:phage portal protein BeeE
MMMTSTKASKTGRAIYMQTMGRPSWTPRDYAKLSKESYQMNAVSYRCVRLTSPATSMSNPISSTRRSASFLSCGRIE